MIFLYETMGWWRLSSSLKKVHFTEDENDAFKHLGGALLDEPRASLAHHLAVRGAIRADGAETAIGFDQPV